MNIKNILIAVCLVSLMILGACNKSPTTGPNAPLVKMQGESVKAHLDENFIFSKGCDYTARATYYIPTDDWIQKKLIPKWFEYRSRNKIMYDVNTENCQDFSFYCHLAAQEIEEGSGVAVGVFFYHRDIDKGKPIGHSINIILVNVNNEKVEVRFFEPQTSQIIHLSKDEIASCNFWYF